MPGLKLARLWSSCLLLCSMTVLPAFGQAPAASPAPKAPPAVPAEEKPLADPKTVEEGFTQIEAELNTPPAGVATMSADERTAAIKTKVEKVLALVEKTTALKPDADKQKELVELKLQMLSVYGRVGGEGAAEKLTEYLKVLVNDPNPEIANLAKAGLLSAKIESILELKGDARTKVVDEIKAEILAGEPNDDKLELANELASTLGYTDDTKGASKLYEEFAKFFGASEDERTKAMAESFAGSARRLNLPGNEMEVKGTTIKNEPFDLAQHKGKVVLVDFWATWCGPCIAEFPNMLALYEVYHPHGFEIVGISLDDDRAQLTKFLEAKKIPWIILHEEGGSKVADYYGVNAIPSMVLVNAEGKVVSINARGEALGEELAKLYPKVKAPAPEVDAEAKPATKSE